MSLLVKHILDHNLLDGAKLVAGEKGIGKPVLWVNFMEILDALDSLQEGELLVTTGFHLDDEARFQDFILRLKSRGVCAIAIQTGYYIHEIPKYILRDADRYDLPIIDLPSRLTFSEIMHVLMENIEARTDEKNDREINLLKSKATKLIAEFRSRLSQEQREEKSYLMLADLTVSSSGAARTGLKNEAERLKACLAGRCVGVEMDFTGSTALFAFSLKGDFTLNDIWVELIRLVTAFSREDRINVWAGISDVILPQDADTAFDQAFAAMGKLREIRAKKGVCCFSNVHLFEWLEYFSGKNNSLSFAYDVLKPLIAYDSFHSSEYLHTLRTFLTNEGRISETSARLFIHRHTLNKRIEKISNLCAADFSDYFSRLHYSLALLVYDFFLS